MENLTAEVLKNNTELKKQFIKQFIEEGDVNDKRVKENLISFLMEIPDEKDLVMKVMSGVRDEELKIRTKGPLVSHLNTESQFLLDPIPNLYFTRDPFACIGNGVSLNLHVFQDQKKRNYFWRICIEVSFGVCRSDPVLL